MERVEPTRVYEPLSDAAAQRIIEATFTLLSDTGVAFDPDPAALDRFADAGCEITSDHVVKFPSALVEESLAQVAKSYRLWNRDGTASVEVGGGDPVFMPGMTNIKVFDLETGESRTSTSDDLATITRVSDGLPNIDAVCVSVKDVPNSTLRGEIGEFATMAENTTKPLEYLCENAAALDAAIEMAAVIRGGMENLSAKPYFTHTITPLPLYYARTHSDQIIRGAECGIPTTTGTIAIGGASAPFSVAGCMTHALATDFAGVVLSQLVRPGVFCGGCAEAAFMEPATGGIGSKTRTMLSEMALRQVKSRLGLPALVGTAGESAARRFNQDAVWDLTAGMIESFYLRPAVVDYLGGLEEGITYSLHALLLCDELAGMLRCMWKGIPVDDDHLALDLSRSVGPKGNYLAERHTAMHCRQNYWGARYFGAKLPLASGTLPDQELFERIDADLRQILASHRPEPMPEAMRAELGAVLERFAGD